jgi:hypothetical protein
MNWIHVIDAVFFILLPIGFMAYAIRYAWNDCKDAGELDFCEKDELTQSETKGAYWCEGCYSWQLPVGHDEHIDSCDCPY